jgi:hypothetical protein
MVSGLKRSLRLVLGVFITVMILAAIYNLAATRSYNVWGKTTFGVRCRESTRRASVSHSRSSCLETTVDCRSYCTNRYSFQLQPVDDRPGSEGILR